MINKKQPTILSHSRIGGKFLLPRQSFLINYKLPPTIAKLLSKKLSCTQPNHQITMKVVNHLPIKKSRIILLKISEAFSAAKHNNKRRGGGEGKKTCWNKEMEPYWKQIEIWKTNKQFNWFLGANFSLIIQIDFWNQQYLN